MFSRFALLFFLALAPATFAGEIHDLLEDGMIDALALLKKSPELVESRNNHQETPLHVAAHRGRREVVKWLLANRANVNAQAYNKFTPLHLTSDGEIAALLVEAGPDLNQRDAWGNTPLQKAAEGKHQAVVEAILASGYKLDLRSAVVLKKVDVVRQLLKDSPQLAKKPSETSSLWGSSTPLGYACSHGNQEIVELLLEAGADVNEGTFNPNAGGKATALTNAVWAKQHAIVKLLLSRGATTDSVGGKFHRTILEYAREHSDTEMIKLLEQAAKE